MVLRFFKLTFTLSMLISTFIVQASECGDAIREQIQRTNAFGREHAKAQIRKAFEKGSTVAVDELLVGNREAQIEMDAAHFLLKKYGSEELHRSVFGTRIRQLARELRSSYSQKTLVIDVIAQIEDSDQVIDVANQVGNRVVAAYVRNHIAKAVLYYNRYVDSVDGG